MIDISPKFQTLRYARAGGEMTAGKSTIELVREKKIPKGDVLQVARAAGILAAKNTADWLVFCHTMPLDWVEVSIKLDDGLIKVEAQVKSIWKTGVEMEALTAVTAALLNIYDMLKPVDSSLEIKGIRLLEKKGGKSDFTPASEPSLETAVLVISDGVFEGKREDKSGLLVQEFLKNQALQVKFYEVLPDEREQIQSRLESLVDREKVELVFTVGGTGIGPRDVTPEATMAVIEKNVPGIAEAIRKHGKDRLPYAMLSREISGIRGGSLIVNLPGSPKGAKESLQALFPGLLHAFHILQGGGH